MPKEVEFVAFESGSLRRLAANGGSREAVLALPLNRLLVKMVHVPSGEDARAVAEPLLKSISPYPDDALTVGVETVRESENGSVVLAAALPESATDDIGEALDAAKLSIVKVDSLVLGELRGIWDKVSGEGRRLILFESPDCLSLLILDGDSPSVVRALTADANLRLEITLSLLEAEHFNGAMPLTAAYVVRKRTMEMPAEDPVSAVLATFAPVKEVVIEDDMADLKGIAARAAENCTLDALPASWREMLEETRFKRKMFMHLAWSCGIWALLMLVLFGVPVVYRYMEGYQKDLSREHARQYREVEAMKKKTEIVRKYSDHARGALEIMKAVSDRLPEGIELRSWHYDRLNEEKGEGGLRIDGESDEENDIYIFQRALEDLTMGEGDDAQKVFQKIRSGAVTPSKGGKQRFSFECLFIEADQGE